MRASKRIRMIMIDKGVKINELAVMTDKSPRTLYNTFYNDEKSKNSGMTFSVASQLAEALGCEIVFRDKETGKTY